MPITRWQAIPPLASAHLNMLQWIGKLQAYKTVCELSARPGDLVSRTWYIKCTGFHSSLQELLNKLGCTINLSARHGPNIDDIKNAGTQSLYISYGTVKSRNMLE